MCFWIFFPAQCPVKWKSDTYHSCVRVRIPSAPSSRRRPTRPPTITSSNILTSSIEVNGQNNYVCDSSLCDWLYMVYSSVFLYYNFPSLTLTHTCTDESRQSAVQLASDRYALQRAKGWRVHHALKQMKEMVSAVLWCHQWCHMMSSL